MLRFNKPKKKIYNDGHCSKLQLFVGAHKEVKYEIKIQHEDPHIFQVQNK